MMFSNPYEAYQLGSVISQNPIQLITALYEGGISSVQEAKRCFEMGDVMGRSKAVTKAVNILAELEFSLKPEQAEEVTGNLKRLYAYMRQRLMDAHMNKVAEPFEEAEGLLRTLVEGWYAVDQQQRAARAEAELMDHTQSEVVEGEDDILRVTYGGYYREPVETFSALAYSF